MSRSRKKQPIRGITSAESEKADKQAAHRAERRKVHEALTGEEPPEVLPHAREVSDPWAMDKDRKIYLGERATARDLRK